MSENKKTIKNLAFALLAIVIVFLGVLFYAWGKREELPGDPLTSEESTQAPGDESSLENGTQVIVVFYNQLGEDTCERVFPTRRQIDDTQEIGRAAIEELLGGPTQEEASKKDYFTNIPEGTALLSLDIADGIAIADFSTELDLAAGACQVLAIREQITLTLMQFLPVRAVKITVEGRSDGVLQP